MEGILVPIFVCVVLPVAIVWIVKQAAVNADNVRAKVLLKAIESGNNIDTESLTKAFQKPKLSARELLNLRLLRGVIFTLVGLLSAVILLLVAANHDNVSEEWVTVFLLISGISFAVGIGYLIVYFVTRHDVDDVTEADKGLTAEIKIEE